MKKKVFIICFIFLLSVTFVTMLILDRQNSEKMMAKQPIPNDVKTSSEIVEIIPKIYSKYLDFSNYTLSDMNVSLDSNLEGIWSITYVEKKGKKPKIVYVEVDTKEHYSFDFIIRSFHSKLYNGRLPNRIIDSNDAIEKAKEIYKRKRSFKYDEVRLFGGLMGDIDVDGYWTVIFDDSASQKSYYVDVIMVNGNIESHYEDDWE